MRNLTKSICALTMAMTVLSTSFSAYAAEPSNEYETVDELLQDAENITREDVEALENSSNIVRKSFFGRSSFAMFFSDEAVATESLVAGNTRYTTSTSTANFAGLGYSNNHRGPISIVEAKLNNSTDVYVIGLSGTDFVENQATGIVTDLLAGFNINNPYKKAVIAAISNNIPAGSNLIFTGHSLGGMVAQQVIADCNIKKNYNILNTVTFGSPVINGLNREGAVQRLGDKNDMIPYLSTTGIFLPVRAIGGLNREDGGYGNVLNFWSAHMGSYCRTDVWGNYDVLGYKNGNATLTYDVATVQYFMAPTRW